MTIKVAQFTIYTKESITFCKFSLNLFIWLDQNEPARYQLADRFTGRIKKLFQIIPTAVPKSKRSLWLLNRCHFFQTQKFDVLKLKALNYICKQYCNYSSWSLRTSNISSSYWNMANETKREWGRRSCLTGRLLWWFASMLNSLFSAGGSCQRRWFLVALSECSVQWLLWYFWSDVLADKE